jgi:MFS family permease
LIVKQQKLWKDGWTAAFIAILFQMIVYGIVISSFSFWVAGWVKEFHVPRFSIIYCVVLSYVTAALIAPFVGAAMERWPARNVVSAGLLCFASGYAMLSFVRAPWQIAAIYSVALGSALALCGPVSAQTMMVKWFAAQRGLAFGIVLTGSALGGIVMTPLVTFLLSVYDWRTVSLLTAAMGFLAAPVIWFCVGNPPKAVPPAEEGEPAPVRAFAAADRGQWTTGAILSNRNFWMTAIALVPIGASFQAIGANYSLMLADNGISAQTAAFFYSLMGICTVIGKPIVGRLSDRYDHRFLLFAGTLVMGAGDLLAFLGGHVGYLRLAVGSVLVSAAPSFFFPMQGAIISRYFGKEGFGRTIGLLNLLFLFGAAGPPAAAMIRDRFGSYHPFIIGAATLPILTASFLFWLRPQTAPRLLERQAFGVG